MSFDWLRRPQGGTSTAATSRPWLPQSMGGIVPDDFAITDSFGQKGATSGRRSIPLSQDATTAESGVRPSTLPPPRQPMEPLNTETISAPLTRPDGLVDLPIRPNVPLNEMRWSARDNRPHGRQINDPRTPMLPAPDAMGENPNPPNTSRVGVPIPQLPGRTGEPQSYSPIGAARHDYVMQGAKRDESGRLLNKDEGGGIKRSWKDIGRNALVGALQGMGNGNGLGGAIGGAAVGGLGTAIDPTRGREYSFNQLQAPALMRQQAEAQQVADQARADRMAGLDERYKQAQIGNLESQTQTRSASAEYDNALKKARAESAAALAESRIKGRPITKAIYNPDTDEVEYITRYPNEVENWGQSGDAYLKNLDRAQREQAVKDQIEARLKAVEEQQKGADRRVGVQESGRNARTTQTETGKDRRASMMYGTGATSSPSQKPSIGMDAVTAYAQEKGISVEEAKKRFETKYKVTQ